MCVDWIAEDFNIHISAIADEVIERTPENMLGPRTAKLKQSLFR